MALTPKRAVLLLQALQARRQTTAPDSSALVVRIPYVSQMCLLAYKVSNFGAESASAGFLLGSTMKMEVICSSEA
jgi:hypothetical protein